MKIKLLSVVVFALLLGACSVPKDVAYFQGVDSLTAEQVNQMAQNYDTKICQDDLLNISVSAWDPSVVTPFNPPVYSYALQGENPVKPSESLYTYLVDKEGNINFPVLGKVHVVGLSKQELSADLEKRISKYVQDPMVTVLITNFKVTVLGEVMNPGGYPVQSDRVSILDAIGYSGDLTINGNRKNVLVIRDINGRKEYGRLDLTDPAVFTSPYYYLCQNDVVYVEPNAAKKRNARFSQAEQYNVTVFSSILSAVSVIATVILAITK